MPSLDDAREPLSTVPIFSGIRRESLDVLARRAVPRRAGPGSVLWTQGTSSKGLYLLLSGHVRAVRIRDGREAVLHRSGPGATLGEIPLFDRGSYPATLIADTEVSLLVIDRETLAAAMEKDIELAWRFLRSLSFRIRELAARLESQTTDSVTTRLARHLARRAALEGLDSFGLGATQAAVARDLGTVREVLARTLGALVRSGIIRRSGRARFALLDADALHALAEGQIRAAPDPLTPRVPSARPRPSARRKSP